MKRHTRPFLLILCAFLLLFSAAVSEGYAPWSEEDLWFYSDDMTVTQKPKGESTGGFMAYCIRLKDGEEKTDHIEGDAIFIDDSFAERRRVKEACGIPVFDVDMVESLLDWRR